MSNDDSEPGVPIVCTECNTESRIPLSEVGDALQRHNDQRHDGEEIAEVDPEIKDHLADLIATELGLTE